MSLPSVIKGMQEWSWFPTGGWNESEILLIQHLITTIDIKRNSNLSRNQPTLIKLHIICKNIVTQIMGT